MMFLFTQNNTIGSKLIRGCLDTNISHFAIVFDEDKYGIVFHSRMLQGVGLQWWTDFRANNHLVSALRPKVACLATEEKIYNALVGKYYGHGYDFSALPEFGFYGLRRKLTGRAIPSRPHFGSSHHYLCSEIAIGLKEVCPEFVPNPLPDTLIEPSFVLQNMSQSKVLEQVLWTTNHLSLRSSAVS